MSHPQSNRVEHALFSSATTCRVKLIEQRSHTPCILGENFDCYAGGRTMWVSKGCRGKFRCSETLRHCGGSQPRQYNCTCLWDGTDSFTYPSEDETVHSLRSFVNRSHEAGQVLRRYGSVRNARAQAMGSAAEISDPPKWLGAIISTNTNSVRFKSTARSAIAAGFEIRHVLAATPSSYRGKTQMLQELFGTTNHPPIMISMTAFEIALLISHKRALRAITLSRYAWGAIFEDDAYVHGAVSPPNLDKLHHRYFRFRDLLIR